MPMPLPLLLVAMLVVVLLVVAVATAAAASATPTPAASANGVLAPEPPGAQWALHHRTHATPFDNDGPADRQTLELDGDGNPLFYKLTQLSELKGTCAMQTALRDMIRAGAPAWTFHRCGAFMRELGRREWQTWHARVANFMRVGVPDSPLACRYQRHKITSLISPQCDNALLRGVLEAEMMGTVTTVADVEPKIAAMTTYACQMLGRGAGQLTGGFRTEADCHRDVGRVTYLWLRYHVYPDDPLHPENRERAVDLARRSCISTLADTRFAPDLPPARYPCEDGAFDMFLRERTSVEQLTNAMHVCLDAMREDANLHCCHYGPAGYLSVESRTFDDAIDWCLSLGSYAGCCVRGLGAEAFRHTVDFGQVELVCGHHKLEEISDECFSAAFKYAKRVMPDGFPPELCDGIVLMAGWRKACHELQQELAMQDLRWNRRIVMATSAAYQGLT